MSGESTKEIRTFRLFLGYRLFTMLAGEMVQAAVPLMIYKETSSVTWSGIAYTAVWLPRVLLQPVMGALLDAVPPKAPFAASDVGRAAIAALLICTNGPYLLLLGGACFGLCSGMAFMAVERAVTHSLGVTRTPSVQSMLQFAEQSAKILGPFSGALLVAASENRLVFLASLLVYATALPVNARIFPRTEERTRLPQLAKLYAGMAAGVYEILANHTLLALGAVTAAINFVEGVCVASLPARVVGSLHHSDRLIGAILSISAGENLVLLLLISRYFGATRSPAVFKFGFLLIPLGAGLFAGASDIWLTGAGYITMITGRVLYTLHMRIERARLIQKETFSATMGAYLSITLAPLPLAGLALSMFGPFLGVEHFIEIVAALFALSTIPALLTREQAH